MRVMHPLRDEEIARAAGGMELSSQHMRIISELLLGLPIKLIAARIGSKEETVRTHLKRMYRRFGVRSRMELVLLFISHARDESSPSPPEQV